MYDMIFKRKSFHLFRNLGNEKLTESDLQDIKEAYKKFEVLCPDVRTEIKIVSAKEKIFGRGAEYAIEIYSEKKENALMNVGYIGEQLDLYLVSKNIGTLWFGLGKPDEEEYHGLSFVITILIAKVDAPDKFRKEMMKSKRMAQEKIWEGDFIPGVTDIVRFAPSACNSQPWRVKRDGDKLTVYRYRKPGKIGIMPAAMVSKFNRIDMGIFLRFLNLCLEREHYGYTKKLFVDDGSNEEWTINAEYTIDKQS